MKEEVYIDYLALNEHEAFPSVKFMNMLDIFPGMLVLSSSYLLINGIIAMILPNDIISSVITLITYIIMLFIAQKWIGKIRHSKYMEFTLESKETSACFLLVLLLNSICLLVLTYENNESTYCLMAIWSLTLYVGFTISLEKLFVDDIESSIKYQLMKPFIDIELGLIKAPLKCIIIIIMIVALMIWEYAMVSIVLILSWILVAVIYFGKKNMGNYVTQIIEQFSTKKILILHLGPPNAVTKTVRKRLDVYCERINDVDKDFDRESYDVIIILNTLRNHRDKVVIKNLNRFILNKGGIILDPFKSRTENLSFWLAWFGISRSIKKGKTMEEYLNTDKQ